MSDEEVNLNDSLASSAARPASFQQDGQTTVEHPLPDQIAAAKFLPPARIRRRAGAGISIARMTPGGAA